MAFVNDRSETPWKTIDRERNITLQKKYSYPDGINGYQLDIDGAIVKLKAFEETRPSKDNKWSIKRKIFGLYIPSEAALDKKQVIQLIEEAFQVHGATCGGLEMDFVETCFI